MKTLKRITAVVLMTVLFVVMLPVVSKAEEKEDTVRVIVRNDVMSKEDGAPYEGTLCDTLVKIDASSTMTSVIAAAMKQENIEIEGLNDGYITAVGGLFADTINWTSGFSVALNDWFTNEGITAYSVEKGNLKAGDVISIEYTKAWGADIGSVWGDPDTSAKSIILTGGELDKTFDKSVTEYTFTPNENVKEINIDAKASNRNYQLRVYANEYTPEKSDTQLNRFEPVSLEGINTLYIGIGNENWPSMNSDYKETVYKIIVNANQEKEPEKQPEDTTSNTEEFENKASFENAYKEVMEKFLSEAKPVSASVGGEIRLLAVSAGKYSNDEYLSEYYDLIRKTILEKKSDKLSNTKATENARVIIALASLGYDASAVAGYNLYAPLEDKEFATRQGVNGAIWSLYALDSTEYTTKNNIRNELVDYILSYQSEGGLFTFDNKTEDIDITAMALTALAPYVHDEKVKNAVDKGIDALSNSQKEDGTLKGTNSAESYAQTVIALSTLGIDAAKDERFVKNGKSLFDVFMSYYKGEGEFSHTQSEAGNVMATEQAALAMTAYSRYLNNEATVYDMKNVTKKSAETVETVATGDTSMPGMWLGLMSLGVIAAVTLKRRKNA